MHKLSVVFIFLFVLCDTAKAEMISGAALGNDPELEKRCIKIISKPSRPTYPIAMQSEDVEYIRRNIPSAVILLSDSNLTICGINTLGKFDLIQIGGYGVKDLSEPKHFEPGLNTPEGINMAHQECLNAAEKKIKKSNPENHYKYIANSRLDAGQKIAGAVVARYDIYVMARATYKTGSLESDAYEFVCLFSPMLKLKGVKITELR